MNEDEFVEHLKETFGADVKKISDVEWTTISQEELDNNSFAQGKPFYLVAPQDYWEDIMQNPQYHAVCRCIDYQGNPIPNCTPASPYFPIAASICIDTADPGNYNDKHGRVCAQQGDSWYQLTCYVPCF